MSDDEKPVSTLFRDALLMIVFIFLGALIIVLPHLNPKIPPVSASARPPGSIIVEIEWPDGVDVDVDLWVKAPGERSVGYSNKSQTYFNLLRDDLGMQNDKGIENYETSYSRGAPEGEWIVNVHEYRNGSSLHPVPVKAKVTLIQADGMPATIYEGSVELTRVGEEITITRFSLDAEARLIYGSQHNLYKPLRSSWSAAQ